MEPFPWAEEALRKRIEENPIAALADRGIDVPPDLPEGIVQEFVRITHLLWVNGETVSVDRFRIDPSDEGLLFGRGVWESTRTISGVPWLWPLHRDRMAKSAELLGIELTPNQLPDAESITKFVRSVTTQDVILRLNATAGRPGKSGLVWMSLSPQPYPTAALRLKTCRNPVRKGQAYLTLKTFQYATRLRLGRLAAQAGFDTSLMLDDDDHVQEAAHANFFARFADGWATPTADGGLLPGTVRHFLLDMAPVPIRERIIHKDELALVEEAFVTNSNVGIIPVTAIDDKVFPVGPDTRKLIEWIEPEKSGVEYRFIERKPQLR